MSGHMPPKPGLGWLDEGDKYAFIGLSVKLEESIPLARLTPHHWVQADPGFAIPSHWREWLGSIRVRELESHNLFLISKMASKTPGVLDGENQLLQSDVSDFYSGLLLSSAVAPSHRPVLLTGSRQDDEIGIRTPADFDPVIPHLIRHYPALLKPEIEQAARIAVAIGTARADDVGQSYWRFFRLLSLYIKARSIRDNLERLHQYCRCIEGLLMTAPGSGEKQFKSRTELFVGPRHHQLMGDVYAVRGVIEHLHEHRFLEVFDRDVMLGLLQKEVVAEYVARTALARIAGSKVILHHFANAATLAQFWKLDADKRRERFAAAAARSIMRPKPAVVSGATRSETRTKGHGSSNSLVELCGGPRPRIYLPERSTMSRTCVAAQRPPRAVGMPRASSCAAIPLYECTPAARISANTGASARARLSAWATIACLAAARASRVNLPLIGSTESAFWSPRVPCDSIVSLLTSNNVRPIKHVTIEVQRRSECTYYPNTSESCTPPNRGRLIAALDDGQPAKIVLINVSARQKAGGFAKPDIVSELALHPSPIGRFASLKSFVMRGVCKIRSFQIFGVERGKPHLSACLRVDDRKEGPP
jgi:hypothetical protein